MLSTIPEWTGRLKNIPYDNRSQMLSKSNFVCTTRIQKGSMTHSSLVELSIHQETNCTKSRILDKLAEALLSYLDIQTCWEHCTSLWWQVQKEPLSLDMETQKPHSQHQRNLDCPLCTAENGSRTEQRELSFHSLLTFTM